MRLRTDLFTYEQIELLMGNIEDILHFQQSFFQLLKLSINEQNLHESLIGKCFLLYVCSIAIRFLLCIRFFA
jgi:hypothetical protein